MPANAALTDGLVAYYCFDDASNIGKDCSTKGNNGSPIGQVGSVTGWKGNAALFGGYYNPANIRVPNSSSLQFAQDFSVSFAVKMTGFDGIDGYGRYVNYGSHAVIAKSHDRNGTTLMVGGDGATGHLSTWVQSFGWNNPISTPTPYSGVGKWVHLTYVLSNSQQKAKLYANGVLISTKDGFSQSFTSINSQDLYLGKYPDSWYPLNGALDEVRIYNRVLTDAEVGELYNQGAGANQTYCSLADKVSLTGEDAQNLAKVLTVDASQAILFPSSVDAVIEYKNLTNLKIQGKNTVSALTKQIEKLKAESNNLTTVTYGRASKSTSTWQNTLEAKKLSKEINLLSRDKALAKADYDNIAAKMKAKPTPLQNKLAKASAALNFYSFAMSSYQLYGDVQNIAEGKDLAYDWANAALHTTEIVSSGLGLYEYIAAVKPNIISKGLARTAAPLVAAQAVSSLYEWSRDATIFGHLNNILDTYKVMTELRYFHTDQIVDELIAFAPETQHIDELRYKIMLALEKYPVVYENNGSTFVASQEFINYLANSAFLQRNFGKLTYQELTPPELAEVAAVYVLGKAGILENNQLRKTSIDTLTKPPKWGDVVAGAFGGKDSYKVFLDTRSVILDTVKSDNVYENLRDRFDSTFFNKQNQIIRQIGEKIHYYECP
jgi:hypothetical protein